MYICNACLPQGFLLWNIKSTLLSLRSSSVVISYGETCSEATASDHAHNRS